MFDFPELDPHSAYLFGLQNKMIDIISKDDSPEMLVYSDLVFRIITKLSDTDFKTGALEIELTKQETELIVRFEENSLMMWTGHWSQKYGKLLKIELMSNLYECELISKNKQVSYRKQPKPDTAILVLSWKDPKAMVDVYAKAISLMEEIVKQNSI